MPGLEWYNPYPFLHTILSTFIIDFHYKLLLQETHFKFIYCVERLHLMDRHSEWRSCFGVNNFDPTPLNTCYNNGIGFQVPYFTTTTSLQFNTTNQQLKLYALGYSFLCIAA